MTEQEKFCSNIKITNLVEILETINDLVEMKRWKSCSLPSLINGVTCVTLLRVKNPVFMQV